MLRANGRSPVPKRVTFLAFVIAATLLLAAACGGDSPEATSTVVPAPTLPTAVPPVAAGGTGPTQLNLGPLYTEASLTLLPQAEPLGIRDLVEAIDASAAFTVRRVAAAGSPQPVLVAVCSPFAPDGVVFQTQHVSGAVATLFVWAYDDTSAISHDWVTIEGQLRPLPPRPLSAFAPGVIDASPTSTATATATPAEDGDEDDGEAENDEDQQSLCTTTANATRGMLTAFRHENLIVVLTAANPHPGTIYTSPGANEELVALVRALEAAP